MTLIEVVEGPTSEKPRLFVDGKELRRGSYYLSRWENKLHLHVFDTSRAPSFLDAAPAWYAQDFDVVELNLDFDWSDLVHGIELRPAVATWGYHGRKPGAPPALSFKFKFDIEAWKHPWSIAELADAMALSTVQLAEQQGDQRIWWLVPDELVSNGCDLSFDLDDRGGTLGDHVDRYEAIARRVYQDAIAYMIQQLRPSSIVTGFDLPVATRVACEQYLLYFIQFLRDLGVEATGDLEESAGQVLFTVTPTSDTQALDRIRQALEVYLKLPTQVTSASHELSGEMAVQRLQANILHLQSQIHLARALLETKDATIGALHATVAVQEMLRDGGLSAGTRQLGPAAPSKETLLGGTVALTPIETHGLMIDLPEIYRRLRRLFKNEA